MVKLLFFVLLLLVCACNNIESVADKSVDKVEVFGENLDFADANFWKSATVLDVKKRIDNGAKVNADGEFLEWNPLSRACYYSTNPEVVGFLIKSGADVNALGGGDEALFRAVQNANLRMKNPRGYIKMIELLLAAGADVNATSREGGFTPLFQAVSAGNVEAVKLLIRYGADVNARDFSDATPLIWAGTWNKPDIAKVLIENGADVNLKDYDGKGVFDYIKID